MSVLVLESSTARLSLAWFDCGACVAAESVEMERGRDAQLFPALHRLMEAAGVKERGAEAILVGLGPGSYTGVRIGIAAAQGLALGWGARVAGSCSLLGLQHSEGMDEYYVVGDARRGNAWMVRIAGGKLAGDFLMQPTSDVERAVGELLAGGAAVLTPEQVPPFPGVIPAWPDAELLGRRTFERDRWARELREDRRLEPLYLAPPYITKAKRRPGSAGGGSGSGLGTGA